MRDDQKTEEALITGCLSKNPLEANRSFEGLVRGYQERIYAVGFRFFGNHDDAMEICQRTFIRVHQKLASFKGASRLHTWLYQIAINLCKNYRRDEGRHTDREVELSEHENAASYDPTLLDDLEPERKLLRQAIQDLPPMQRGVMILRVYEEISFKETAEILNCSESSAKVNFHHAMLALKSKMQDKSLKGNAA